MGECVRLGWVCGGVKVVPWKVQGATMRMCKLLQNAFEPVLVLTKF